MVDPIITDRAVIDVTEDGLKLIEVANGYSVQDIIESTEPKLILMDHVVSNAD